MTLEEKGILRVISGTAKGHKLKTLKSNLTRPTSDRVKESLFNIIAGYVIDADVLDLFAGTGNLGIEALSRGAASAVFVDKSRDCFEIIKDNLTHTKLADRAEILTTDTEAALERFAVEAKRFDLVFLDPPYGKNLAVESLNIIGKNVIIKNNGLIVAEHDIDDELPETVGEIKLVRKQKYRDTVLSFYKKEGTLI
jgi:16S rRNA (guanine(966)-N(2))-methyltransferase RsmD